MRRLIFTCLIFLIFSAVNGFILHRQSRVTKWRTVPSIERIRPSLSSIDNAGREVDEAAENERGRTVEAPSDCFLLDLEKTLGIAEEPAVETIEEEKEKGVAGIGEKREPPKPMPAGAKGPHKGASIDQRAVLRHMGKNASDVAPALPDDEVASALAAAEAKKTAETKKQRTMKVSRFDFIENIFLRLAARVVPDPDLLRVGIKILSLGIWSAILLSILGTLGVDTKPLLSLLGFSGLTLGFALKEFISDTFHSLSVLVSHPFSRGAVVSIGNFKGKVMSMNLQYLRLLNEADKTDILIPLANVYKSAIMIHERVPKTGAAPPASSATTK